MRRINFSTVGVVANSLEELNEIYLTYTALDIPFIDGFEEDCKDAQQSNLVGWFIQCTDGTIETKLVNDNLELSIIRYPIKYSMSSLDFAVACQLLKLNQTDGLIAHLDKYCRSINNVSFKNYV